jgi:glutaredoxin
MQGWSPDFIPKLTEDAVRDGLVDRVVPVNGAEALKTSRRLATEEGILVGISAGATVAGAISICAELPEGANVLAMLPDTGERYLTTPLFEDIPADMTEEELEISRSTPGYRFDTPSPAVSPAPSASPVSAASTLSGVSTASQTPASSSATGSSAVTTASATTGRAEVATAAMASAGGTALAKASSPLCVLPTPQPSAPVAGGVSATAAIQPEAASFVEEVLADRAQPVVLFALEWCEFSWSVRKLFDRLKVPFRSIDLDSVAYQRDDRGGQVRAALAARIGVPTIPQVFIGGEHLGGATDLFDAWRAGKAQRLLDESGVAYDRNVAIDPYSFLPKWLQPR